MIMKVLVCGGRDYNDYDVLKCVMEKVMDCYSAEVKVVISGLAKGGDKLGEKWAEENNIEVEGYRAEWNKYGKRAGWLRNVRMADEGRPNVIVALPGGRGTKMMIDIGVDRKIDTIVVDDENRKLKWAYSKDNELKKWMEK